MYKGKKVAAVVPAYNEEVLIEKVITTMPDFVDLIVVVDDASKDSTSSVVSSLQKKIDRCIFLIRHEKNTGVGGAIVTGHKKALEQGAEINVIMAGDAQMDPDDLPKILDPLIEGDIDFSKGNRFFNGEAWKNMPRLRFYSNAGLSMLNKIASGYWHIADPQCGYTAITRQSLEKLDLDALSRGYHFENSLLIQLNVQDLRVKDVPIKAVYGIGEKSGIVHWIALFSFSFFLLRAFIWRLEQKYIIRDFHPLVFFYFFGIMFLLIGFFLGIYLIIFRLFIDLVKETSAIFAAFLFTSGLQLVLFAMWFDKDYKRSMN